MVWPSNEFIEFKISRFQIQVQTSRIHKRSDVYEYLQLFRIYLVRKVEFFKLLMRYLPNSVNTTYAYIEANACLNEINMEIFHFDSESMVL